MTSHSVPNQITELKTVFQRRIKPLKPAGNLIHLFQDPLTKYIYYLQEAAWLTSSLEDLFMWHVIAQHKVTEAVNVDCMSHYHTEPVRLFSYQHITKWFFLFLWCSRPTWAMAASFLRFLDDTRWHTTVARTYKAFRYLNNSWTEEKGRTFFRNVSNHV
jgi:hypothetical protein